MLRVCVRNQHATALASTPPPPLRGARALVDSVNLGVDKLLAQVFERAHGLAVAAEAGREIVGHLLLR
eukprot:1809221-Pleurochrysis_carterae.AAC.1